MKRSLEFTYRIENAVTWDDIIAGLSDMKTRFGDPKRFAVADVHIKPGELSAHIIVIEPDEAGINIFFGDVIKRWTQWKKKKK